MSLKISFASLLGYWNYPFAQTAKMCPCFEKGSQKCSLFEKGSKWSPSIVVLSSQFCPYSNKNHLNILFGKKGQKLKTYLKCPRIVYQEALLLRDGITVSFSKLSSKWHFLGKVLSMNPSLKNRFHVYSRSSVQNS